ncbi:MAG: U32 family peptidase, partial [bacterium]
MKPELLAPAGDLERLKIALRFGADAVYVGGPEYSLRARASNFSIADIAEGVACAHRLGKKLYATANIIPTNDDLAGLDDYLLALEKAGVDAVIVAAPVVLDRARALTSIPVHLSTQQSVTTSAAAAFWQKAGIERIVLARELSLAEIRLIAAHTTVELEVFIHGGMCAAYAGRCTISNYLADRDANRGGCAHSCRWDYRLTTKTGPLGAAYDFAIGAKDLETLAYIPALIDAGVTAFKIEGRMKSANYVATTVACYRRVIDDHLAGMLQPGDVYRELLAKAENRIAADGFFGGLTSARHQLYDRGANTNRQDFLGYVTAYDPRTGKASFELKNALIAGDVVEAFPPDETAFTFPVTELFTADGSPVDSLRKPMETVGVFVPRPLPVYTML